MEQNKTQNEERPLSRRSSTSEPSRAHIYERRRVSIGLEFVGLVLTPMKIFGVVVIFYNFL